MTSKGSPIPMSPATKVRAAAVQIAPDLRRARARPRVKVVNAIERGGGQGRGFDRSSRDLRPLVSLFLLRPAAGAKRGRNTSGSTSTRSPSPAPRPRLAPRGAQGMESSSCSGSTSATTARSTTRNSCSTPTASLKLKRRKITPTFPRAHDLGAGRRLGAHGGRHQGRPRRRARLLGALQSARPLRPDGAARGDPRRRSFPGSLVGPIFAEQIEVTIRHHALESGCFVVNATGWLTEAQIASITPNEGLQRRCAAAA